MASRDTSISSVARDTGVGGTDLTKDRDHLNRRMAEMTREFSSFKPHYKELSEFTDPRRGRFFLEDRNKGQKRHKNILNNFATVAVRRAAAGMLAGAVSPSRPWFAWDMFDKDILRDPEVAAWLDLFRRVILTVLNKSNFYNMAPMLLRELLLFGTGAMTHEDDFDDVARFYTHTAGSYMTSQNSRLVPDTLARQFQMTASQIVGQFGIENVSTSVKNNYDNSNYGAWHTVNHMIELNPFRDEARGQLSSEFLPFRSVYWERNTRSESDKVKFLQRKGNRGFPAYVLRWEVTGEDVYSTNCPGMTALGDTKQLQAQELEKAKAIAKSSTPVLQGPPSLRNHPIPNLPGGVVINSTTNAKIESVYTVDPRINELNQDIDRTERRIGGAYYNDLFRAITDMAGIQPRNELQLSQINEERLLELGPVLEQVHGEWLAKLVGRTARQVLEAGIMPPAPQKLEGQETEIEFISALAMAQRAVATGAIEKTVTFAGVMIQNGWNVQGKVDPDFAIDEYASLVGAPPKLIVPTSVVQEQRDAEAKAQQRQEQLAMGQQAANIGKLAADSKLEDKNVLSTAMDNAQQAAGQ